VAASRQLSARFSSDPPATSLILDLQLATARGERKTGDMP
jgi:hypothetical protein